MADNVLDHHNGASTTMRVERAQRQQFAGMWLISRQIDANKSAKGIVIATISARAHSQERKTG